MENKHQKLPYRYGVGLMILNDENKIFIGKRICSHHSYKYSWQMPQGGINLGETPSSAALREMEEEIGCRNGDIIAESESWYRYDIPKHLIKKLWSGMYKGQQQKWFLIKFRGTDENINLKKTKHPEFYRWRWVEKYKLSDIVVPFKKNLYKKVIIEFKNWIK